MSTAEHDDHARMRDAFAAYFKDYSIQLPPDLQSSGGAIKKRGWDIRYILGQEGGRNRLEFYAMHRMTSDRHLKIYEDGAVVSLPAVSNRISYRPEVSGDRERAERERKAKDEPLIADLKQKGLW